MKLTDFSKVLDKAIIVIMTACICIMGMKIRMLEKQIDKLQETYIMSSWNNLKWYAPNISLDGAESEEENTSN